MKHVVSTPHYFPTCPGCIAERQQRVCNELGVAMLAINRLVHDANESGMQVQVATNADTHHSVTHISIVLSQVFFRT